MEFGHGREAWGKTSERFTKHLIRLATTLPPKKSTASPSPAKLKNGTVWFAYFRTFPRKMLEIPLDQPRAERQPDCEMLRES